MQKRFSVGQTYRASFKIDASIIERFAELSVDENPIHLDPEEAKAYGYPRQVAHGALLVALLSKMTGMEIPGRGQFWKSQSIEWVAPVFAGVVAINHASAKAFQNAGFEIEGSLKSQVYLDEEYYDSLCLGMVNKDS